MTDDASILVRKEVADLFEKSVKQYENETGVEMTNDEFMMHLLVWSAEAQRDKHNELMGYGR